MVMCRLCVHAHILLEKEATVTIRWCHGGNIFDECSYLIAKNAVVIIAMTSAIIMLPDKLPCRVTSSTAQ